MLLSMGAGGGSSPRWVVFAYDIASAKRARSARAALAAYAGPRQYSVLECRMYYGWSRDLLAEVATLLDPTEDRLALWWPRDGARIGLEHAGRMSARASTEGMELTVKHKRCAELLRGAGNFVISYDIGCAKRAQRIHAVVAGGGVMLQRSVYQWRCPAAAVMRLLDRCSQWLEPGDRFWVHPLRRSGDLWQVSDAPTSLLPMGTHHWSWSGR